MPAPLAAGLDRDANLLFGVLCLQADLIDASQFAEACALWAARKTQPLADLLCERGWLSDDDRNLIDTLVQKKLRKHGDARASLAAVVDDNVRRSLSTVGDAGMKQALGILPPAPAPVLTTAYQPRQRERYEVLHLHARGGMGQVWLAHDGDLGRDVALKDLKPEAADNETARLRFLQEAQVTGQLEHPSIVPVYELVRPEGGAPFYTMRFVKGQTLSEAVRGYHRKRTAGTASSLDLQTLLNAFVAVCNALAYAHARGVVHRDLKGPNVLLGDFGEVVVLDWGLAKLTGQVDRAGDALPLILPGSGDSSATRQGQVLGTPAYMAPEQASGRLDQIDVRTDVYGLGAILYEVLTGKPPFVGDDMTEVLRRVQQEAPVRPRQLCSQAPAALEAVCLKALAKKPQDRYATAGDLAAEVRRFLADEPVAAYRDPLPARAARWARRHKTLVAAAAVLLLASVGLLGVVATLSEQGRRRSDAERARTEMARAEADEQRRAARKAVDEYFTRVSESRLLDVPGMEALRNELLLSSRAYYEGFVKQQSDNPAVRAELARSHYRLALMTDRVGSKEEARQRYEKACRLYEELVAEGKATVEWHSQLSVCYCDLGLLLGETGQVDRAFREYDRARSIQEKLSAAHRDNIRVPALLARTELNAGSLYEQTGHIERAQSCYTKAQNILEVLVAKKATADVEADLARAWRHAGELMRELGRYPESLRLFQKSLATLQRLARQESGTSSQHLLATVHQNLGLLRRRTGDFDEAAKAFQEALRIREKLAGLHPAVTDFQSNLGETLISTAELQAANYEHDRAALTVRQAIKVLTPLTRDNPTNTRFRARLAVIHNNLGIVLTETEKPAEGLENEKLALAARLDLARNNPSLVYYQSSVADAHNNIANALRKLQKPEEALHAYDAARVLYEKLIPANPALVAFRRHLGIIEDNIGWIHLDQGRPAEALDAFQKALALRQELAAKTPSAIFQAEMAASYFALARAQWKLGFPRYQGVAAGLLAAGPHGALRLLPVLVVKPEGTPRKYDAGAALVSYEKARTIQEKLVKDYPKVLDFAAGLLRTTIEAGNVHRDAWRNVEGFTLYRKAVDLGEKLVRARPAVALFRNHLAVSHYNLGLTLQDLRMGLAAARSHENARVLRDQLVKEFPGNDEYRDSLARTCNSLGVAQNSLRHFTTALGWLAQAEGLWRPLCAKAPANPVYRSGLAGTLMNHGLALLELRRLEDAVPLLEESIVDGQAALQEEPFNERARDLLGQGYLHLARLRAELGVPAAAAAAARECRKLCPDVAVKLTDAAAALARCAGAVGRGKPALTATEQEERRRYTVEAVDVLRQAFEGGFRYPAKLDDPVYDPLRSSADFKRLMAEWQERLKPAPNGSRQP